MTDVSQAGTREALVEDILLRLAGLGQESAATAEGPADSLAQAQAQESGHAEAQEPGYAAEQEPAKTAAEQSALEYDGLHEAAAVLGWFDADRLEPTRPTSDLARELLIAGAVTVADDRGERRLSLASATRVSVLGQLREDSSVPSALAANAPEKGDTLARLIRAHLTGGAAPLEALSLSEVHSTALVCQWLRDAGFDVMPAETIVRRADWLSLLQPFELLAGRHFRGRTQELARLRAFAGVLPPGATGAAPLPPEAEMVPMMIFGPGGVGKSTLVARFILEHAQALERDRFPFAYLDFDRADVDAAEPITLLIEAVRQLAIEYPGLADRATRIRADWLAQLGSADVPAARARSSAAADFGRLVDSIGAGDRPVLFVLDTFEEVQWRSEEYVAEIWQLLTELSKLLTKPSASVSRLRVVVVGRGEIPDRTVRPLPLTGLDAEAAGAFLQLHGIKDPDAVSRIAAKVGGDPQNLKLAARDYLASQHEGPVSLDSYLADLDQGMIRLKLHGRVLDHIHDPVVRQLAHPGLVLRRLTPELILGVLAKPCRLDVSTRGEAERLFAELRRETSLVKMDVDGALIHRPDLRRSILSLLETDERERTEQIHLAAIDFYAGRPPSPVERAEEIYHRMKLGRSRDEVLARWIPGVENRLINAVDEFDGERHAFLAAQLGLTVSDQVRRSASLPDWERLVARKVVTLLSSGDSMAALALLHERHDRLQDSELVPLEAEALVTLDRPLDAQAGLEAASDRAEQAGLTEVVYRTLRLEAAIMIVLERWSWSSALTGRLARLTAASGMATHHLVRAAVEQAIWSSERPPDQGPNQALATAFDAVTDDDLRADRDLAALAGLQLRTRIHVARLRRLVALVGLPRRDEAAVRRLANQIAQYDRDEHGGSLAGRFEIRKRKSGTEAWSEHLLRDAAAESAAVLVQLLDVYGEQLPDPLLAALADVIGTELSPARWYPATSQLPTKWVSTGDTPMSAPSVAVHVRDLLLDSIARVFSLDSLRTFLRRQFDVSLDSLVPAGATTETTVATVVDYLEGQGRQLEFVARAREVAPADPGLLGAATVLGLSSLSSPGNTDEESVRNRSPLLPEVWRERLGQMEGQICRIEWRGNQQAYGTGFLVAPDLLLTAAHVLGSGTASLGARFDHAQLADGSAVTDGVLFAVDQIVVSDDDLDFAVLRVRGAAGVQPVSSTVEVVERPRGWLEIADPPADPPMGSALSLAHHSSEGSLRLTSRHDAVVGHRKDGKLLYHSLVTRPGSAGGAVLDAWLNPVALHLGWVSPVPGMMIGAGYAVPISAVLRRLDELGLGYLLRSTLA